MMEEEYPYLDRVGSAHSSRVGIMNSRVLNPYQGIEDFHLFFDTVLQQGNKGRDGRMGRYDRVNHLDGLFISDLSLAVLVENLSPACTT
jgi:hypothetical protein